MTHVIGTEPECNSYEALCEKALQLPLRGVHVGGGRHVTIPAVPPGPGWTTQWATIRKHPDKDEYAIAALAPAGHLDTLSSEERAKLESDWIGAQELDSSWEPKGVEQAEGPSSF